MEIGSKKANTSAYCNHTHTELSRWTAQSSRSGLHSLFYTSQKFSLFRPHFSDPPYSSFFSFPLSAPTLFPFPPWTDSLGLFLPSCTYEGCSNNLFPQASPPTHLPQEHYSAFQLLCFLSFPSFCLSPIYLQLDVCSPIDYFTEDMSGLCLCPARLYIDPLKDVQTHARTHRHKHPVSQLVVSQCP